MLRESKSEVSQYSDFESKRFQYRLQSPSVDQSQLTTDFLSPHRVSSPTQDGSLHGSFEETKNPFARASQRTGPILSTPASQQRPITYMTDVTSSVSEIVQSPSRHNSQRRLPSPSLTEITHRNESPTFHTSPKRSPALEFRKSPSLTLPRSPANLPSPIRIDHMSVIATPAPQNSTSSRNNPQTSATWNLRTSSELSLPENTHESPKKPDPMVRKSEQYKVPLPSPDLTHSDYGRIRSRYLAGNTSHLTHPIPRAESPRFIPPASVNAGSVRRSHSVTLERTPNRHDLMLRIKQLELENMVEKKRTQIIRDLAFRHIRMLLRNIMSRDQSIDESFQGIRSGFERDEEEALKKFIMACEDI